MGFPCRRMRTSCWWPRLRRSTMPSRLAFSRCCGCALLYCCRIVKQLCYLVFCLAQCSMPANIQQVSDGPVMSLFFPEELELLLCGGAAVRTLLA